MTDHSGVALARLWTALAGLYAALARLYPALARFKSPDGYIPMWCIVVILVHH
jgi:hypothetical protein